ncbi:MAG: TerB N-terminal domain-containing protein [Oscillospiraceae bacterium]|nr:TerB N-terminal domain-containing protein [Oscillospiraceae bacterium]
MDKDKDWDIGQILPRKKPISRFAKDTEAVLMEFDTTGGKPAVQGVELPKQEITKIKYEAEPLCSYSPVNPLITKVDVWLWPSKFTFYERFRTDAEKNFTRYYGECQHIKFFSYMPQYIQLDYGQRNWYLWWRENVRNKIYLQTDYSYILLYIYEIINLPDLIPAADGIELLMDVWLAYRNEYKRLDRYIIEWLCDYCLINQLNPLFARIDSELMNEIHAQASFKEFYIKIDENSDPYLAMLMKSASNYDWQKSKYVTEETRELFQKYITEAYNYTAKRHISADRMSQTKVTRDAYSGSLCAYNVKRRIDIEYNTFTRSADLRLIVSDVIKYAENKVRAMVGIKGRLSTPSLTDDVIATLEEYFVQFQLKPARKKTKEEEAEDQYAHLYEARSATLSTDAALEIEKESWEITHTLVETFEEEPEEVIEETESIADETKSFIINAIKYILLEDKVGFTAIAEMNNMLEDSLVECINEYIYDIIGDIVIYADDDWYSIIPDYIGEMEELVNGRAATAEDT